MNWVEILAAVLTVAAVITLVWKTIKWAVRVSDLLEEVKREFHPNGGTSLVDKVDRLQEGHVYLAGSLSRIEDHLLRKSEGFEPWRRSGW